MPPISVTASVRGKKYEVEADTVEEFTEKVEGLANLETGQNSVLFRGKVLSPGDKLSEMGIESGDVLMVVKGKKARPSATLNSLDESSSQDSNEVASTGTRSPDLMSRFSGGMPGMPNMDQMNPEDLQNAMQAMEKMLDSDLIDEYFGSDEKLELARQQMLKNMDQYDSMMPGFKEQAGEMVTDPEKWKEAMTKVKEQIVKLKEQRSKMKGTQPSTSDNSVENLSDDE